MPVVTEYNRAQAVLWHTPLVSSDKSVSN